MRRRRGVFFAPVLDLPPAAGYYISMKRGSNIISGTFRKLADILFQAALLVLTLGAVWCSGALFRAFDAHPAVAAIAAISLCGLLTSGIFIRRAALALAIAELSIIAAFCLITPQQRFENISWQTPWQRVAEVRKLDDGRYELKNVRDFHYRSENDFDVDYRTVIVDPRQISSIDAVFSHWDDMEEIAHSMLGLNFTDGTTIVFSLETRLPKGMEQDGIDGLYRRYALAMIVGTPNDLYGLRTDHRGETLYVYRIDAGREYMLQTVRSLLGNAEKMRREPTFYNSLGRNCSTGLLPMLPKNKNMPGCDVRVLLNGLADQMLFERHLIVSREGESFGSLRARSLVPGLCGGKKAPHTRYGGESEARWLKER